MNPYQQNQYGYQQSSGYQQQGYPQGYGNQQGAYQGRVDQVPRKRNSIPKQILIL